MGWQQWADWIVPGLDERIGNVGAYHIRHQYIGITKSIMASVTFDDDALRHGDMEIVSDPANG